jgi:epoxyqueuosine reductase
MNTTPGPNNAPEEWLRAQIIDFVRDNPGNRLQRIDNTPIFDAPLVGYAAGDDPLFAEYKRIIGPFHLTPHEALGADAGDPLSVVCWALPITEATRASNRSQIKEPSQRWAHTRNDGQKFCDTVYEFVVSLLNDAGYRAIAPQMSPQFRIHSEGIPGAPASSWSERHILYAAGMGTFSLSDGFITPKGIAMRCGSVVTDMPLMPTPRTATHHYANCLYYANGRCGVCIARCPAGAITRDGHDKQRCSVYMDREFASLRKEYEVDISGCGLCQTDVPCEFAIPRQG